MSLLEVLSLVPFVGLMLATIQQYGNRRLYITCLTIAGVIFFAIGFSL